MKWRGRRTSRNIEDRRGRRIGGARAGGLGLVAIVVVGALLGVDLTPLLQGTPTSFQTAENTAELTEADQQEAEFVSVTLADTEEVWTTIFQRQFDRAYDPATLVLFKGVTHSPCGGASGATGPFYCPADEKVYLDTQFFTTMRTRLGASGDFAAAYVVAHEVAHHIQQELGILSEANRLRQTSSERVSNAISVRIELQADCFAGLWARHAEQRFGSLEPGDVEEAMNAARQIGDDNLQRSAGRVPRPHTYTHGTSAQRQRWFATGYQSNDVRACDTFSTDNL